MGQGGQPFLNSNLFVYDDTGGGRRIYRPSTDEELRRTAVYRIDIETWSGKQKEVAEDFPGAFTLAAPPVPFPERVAPSD